MEITINIPDEAIQRIANVLKKELRMQANKIRRAKGEKGKVKVNFDMDDAELITKVFQNNVDNLFLRTDPEYIAKKKAIREQNEKADQEAKAKLEALKKK